MTKSADVLGVLTATQAELGLVQRQAWSSVYKDFSFGVNSIIYPARVALAKRLFCI